MLEYIKKLDPVIKFLGAVVALLIGLYTLVTIVRSALPDDSPLFIFQVDGETLQTDTEVVYEISSGIARMGDVTEIQVEQDNQTITINTNFRIKINATRSNNLVGSVHIRLVGADGIAGTPVDSWDNFFTDFEESKVVEFTPGQLVELAGLDYETPRLPTGQAELPESHMGSFTLEIVRVDTGQVIDARTITVLNTPWYHTSTLSKTDIMAGDPVTVYFSVHNLGQKADMVAIFNVYDTTRSPDDPVASTLANDEFGWWMDRSFTFQPLDGYSYDELPDVEEVGYTEYEFASQVFQPCHVYIIETSVRKHLPDIEFSDGNWLSSRVSWWMRDQTSLLTLVVRSPTSECPSS